VNPSPFLCRDGQHGPDMWRPSRPAVATQYHLSASKRWRTSSHDRGSVPGSASLAMTNALGSLGMLSSGS
jgi:hypothetical protein